MPPEIYEELSREVIGQDEAMREVSVALVKHLVGHPGGNILLIGNSGTGKTTLMRAVEAMLARRRDLVGTPLIRINANVLADEHSGYGKTIPACSAARAKSAETCQMSSGASCSSMRSTRSAPRPAEWRTSKGS